MHPYNPHESGVVESRFEKIHPCCLNADQFKKGKSVELDGCGVHRYANGLHYYCHRLF